MKLQTKISSIEFINLEESAEPLGLLNWHLQFTQGGITHLAEMFCVKCKKKVTVDDSAVKRELTVKGRPILKAICPVCGTKMTKFTK